MAAAAASMLAASTVSGFSTVGWATAYFKEVDATDVLLVLGKATLSGYLVALCCYLRTVLF
ncbi:MAG TPA: hypothetical protein PKL42_09125 [Methylotenera sp.]|nr:hypothetical protein [Methylotenera sp.]